MVARPERERKLRELRRILNNAYPEDYREHSRDDPPAATLPTGKLGVRARSAQAAIHMLAHRKPVYDNGVTPGRAIVRKTDAR